MKYLLCSIFLLLNLSARGQSILFEDFDDLDLPQEWQVETMASDGGWIAASHLALSSQFYNIDSNNSPGIIATNDDRCNCNKSSDRLILPVQDFSGYERVALGFDAFYFDGVYQGFEEDAFVEISLDGINWTAVYTLPGATEWASQIVNISDYAGEETVYISFLYKDNGGWMFGLALDNISLKVPATLDAELIEFAGLPYARTGSDYIFSGSLYNNGINVLGEIEMLITINGEEEILQTLSGLDIRAFEEFEFKIDGIWTPADPGIYEIEIMIQSVNGMTDEDLTNNEIAFTVEVFESITRKNIISDILASEPVITTVAGPSNLLDRPTDLAFFPILGKDEIWVVNQRVESTGGSTLTISNAGDEDSRSFLHRVDGNAWHFMSMPTGIVFSEDNFNFATSPGVQDANHSGGTFTGPTLWSSDPLIYAQPSGGNGSHLDMLHASPMSMGIAHEKDNVFWVYDNWNKDIVRYDFQEDHGPGNDDHADGIVRRYRNIGINSDGDIPNHLVMDKSSGWLYFVDNGNDRVMRLDINSGSVTSNLALINEELEEHSAVEGFVVETIAEEGLLRPSGIELIENYLLVSDYESGLIHVFDINNNFNNIGQIETGSAGITGITVGPEGNVWFVNRLTNQLRMVEPGELTSVKEAWLSEAVNLSPNPVSEVLNLELDPEAGFEKLYVYDNNGKVVLTQVISNSTVKLSFGSLNSGVYSVHLVGTEGTSSKRFIKI